MPNGLIKTAALACLLALPALAIQSPAASAAQPGECTRATGQVETRNWQAMTTRQPDGSDGVEVVGEVQVPNPGVEPLLRLSEQQGRNPLVLNVDLYLCQLPGMWTQALAWKPVRLDPPSTGEFTQAHILGADGDVALIEVEASQ
ncbi:hypothetical protein ACKTEK_10180 [Tepidamorphus sp. 3E244]|uniref:hypothetical protein n=1 Tax=Tepidamorphus sp. 3E244 TaxID=3385498 RepID=UPI0038FC7E66